MKLKYYVLDDRDQVLTYEQEATWESPKKEPG